MGRMFHSFTHIFSQLHVHHTCRSLILRNDLQLHRIIDFPEDCDPRFENNLIYFSTRWSGKWYSPLRCPFAGRPFIIIGSPFFPQTNCFPIRLELFAWELLEPTFDPPSDSLVQFSLSISANLGRIHIRSRAIAERHSSLFILLKSHVEFYRHKAAWKALKAHLIEANK